MQQSSPSAIVDFRLAEVFDTNTSLLSRVQCFDVVQRLAVFYTTNKPPSAQQQQQQQQQQFELDAQAYAEINALMLALAQIRPAAAPNEYYYFNYYGPFVTYWDELSGRLSAQGASAVDVWRDVRHCLNIKDSRLQVYHRLAVSTQKHLELLMVNLGASGAIGVDEVDSGIFAQTRELVSDATMRLLPASTQPAYVLAKALAWLGEFYLDPGDVKNQQDGEPMHMDTYCRAGINRLDHLTLMLSNVMSTSLAEYFGISPSKEAMVSYFQMSAYNDYGRYAQQNKLVRERLAGGRLDNLLAVLLMRTFFCLVVMQLGSGAAIGLVTALQESKHAPSNWYKTHGNYLTLAAQRCDFLQDVGDRESLIELKNAIIAAEGIINMQILELSVFITGEYKVPGDGDDETHGVGTTYAVRLIGGDNALPYRVITAAREAFTDYMKSDPTTPQAQKMTKALARACIKVSESFKNEPWLTGDHLKHAPSGQPTCDSETTLATWFMMLGDMARAIDSDIGQVTNALDTALTRLFQGGSSNSASDPPHMSPYWLVIQPPAKDSESFKKAPLIHILLAIRHNNQKTVFAYDHHVRCTIRGLNNDDTVVVSIYMAAFRRLYGWTTTARIRRQMSNFMMLFVGDDQQSKKQPDAVGKLLGFLRQTREYWHKLQEIKDGDNLANKMFNRSVAHAIRRVVLAHVVPDQYEDVRERREYDLAEAVISRLPFMFNKHGEQVLNIANDGQHLQQLRLPAQPAVINSIDVLFRVFTMYKLQSVVFDLLSGAEADMSAVTYGLVSAYGHPAQLVTDSARAWRSTKATTVTLQNARRILHEWRSLDNSVIPLFEQLDSTENIYGGGVTRWLDELDKQPRAPSIAQMAGLKIFASDEEDVVLLRQLQANASRSLELAHVTKIVFLNAWRDESKLLTGHFRDMLDAFATLVNHVQQSTFNSSLVSKLLAAHWILIKTKRTQTALHTTQSQFSVVQKLLGSSQQHYANAMVVIIAEMVYSHLYESLEKFNTFHDKIMSPNADNENTQTSSSLSSPQLSVDMKQFLRSLMTESDYKEPIALPKTLKHTPRFTKGLWEQWTANEDGQRTGAMSHPDLIAPPMPSRHILNAVITYDKAHKSNPQWCKLLTGILNSFDSILSLVISPLSILDARVMERATTWNNNITTQLTRGVIDELDALDALIKSAQSTLRPRIGRDNPPGLYSKFLSPGDVYETLSFLEIVALCSRVMRMALDNKNDDGGGGGGGGPTTQQTGSSGGGDGGTQLAQINERVNQFWEHEGSVGHTGHNHSSGELLTLLGDAFLYCTTSQVHLRAHKAVNTGQVPWKLEFEQHGDGGIGVYLRSADNDLNAQPTTTTATSTHVHNNRTVAVSRGGVQLTPDVIIKGVVGHMRSVFLEYADQGASTVIAAPMSIVSEAFALVFRHPQNNTVLVDDSMQTFDSALKQEIVSRDAEVQKVLQREVAYATMVAARYVIGTRCDAYFGLGAKVHVVKTSLLEAYVTDTQGFRFEDGKTHGVLGQSENVQDAVVTLVDNNQPVELSRCFSVETFQRAHLFDTQALYYWLLEWMVNEDAWGQTPVTGGQFSDHLRRQVADRITEMRSSATSRGIDKELHSHAVSYFADPQTNPVDWATRKWPDPTSESIRALKSSDLLELGLQLLLAFAWLSMDNGEYNKPVETSTNRPKNIDASWKMFYQVAARNVPHQTPDIHSQIKKLGVDLADTYKSSPDTMKSRLRFAWLAAKLFSPLDVNYLSGDMIYIIIKPTKQQSSGGSLYPSIPTAEVDSIEQTVFITNANRQQPLSCIFDNDTANTETHSRMYMARVSHRAKNNRNTLVARAIKPNGDSTDVHVDANHVVSADLWDRLSAMAMGKENNTLWKDTFANIANYVQSASRAKAQNNRFGMFAKPASFLGL